MATAPNPETSPLVRKVERWLRRIGLSVEHGARYEPCFNEGIWVVDGGIVFDPELAHPGDLLHEAGHLAIMPSFARAFANGGPTGDVMLSIQRPIDDYMAAHPDGLMQWPEDPIARACIQCDASEAIAWAYAAAVAAKVDPWLTCERGFGDRNDAEFIFRGLQRGARVGVNGLRAAGFIARVDHFPRLTKWLQP